MYEGVGGATIAPAEALLGLRRELDHFRERHLFYDADHEERLEILKGLAQAQSEISLLIAEGAYSSRDRVDLGESGCVSEWLRHSSGI